MSLRTPVRRDATIIPTQRTRSRWRVFAGSILSAAVLAVGLLAPTAASAVEVDAITGVTITQPTDQVNVGDVLQLQATWAIPDSAVAGDTFSLTFPASPQLAGISDVFAITSPDDLTIADCTVTGTTLTCVLTDYVDTHVGVSGSLAFQARAEQETTQSQVPFTTGGGAVINVPLPGGGIGPRENEPIPTEPNKHGDLAQDGDHIIWVVSIPSSAISGADPSLTDTFTAGLTLVPSTIRLGYVLNENWAGGNYAPGDLVALTPDSEFTLQINSASSFTVEPTVPIVANAVYVLTYQTALPPGVQTGDVFNNTVTGSSFVTESTPFVYSGGGGTGEGDGLGGFSVTKVVTGEGAPLVPADTAFTLNYAYEVAGAPVTGQLTVLNGATTGLDDLPEGTVVTVSEAAPTVVAGVVWQTPTFTGAGVTATEGGAQFTIDDATDVAVALTNPTTVPPPLPLGGFSVTKAVTGAGATSVPGGTAFTVDYSYQVDEVTVTGALTLTNGATAGLDDLPDGTVVTISEAAPAAITGVVWQAPVYTGAGVTATDDGAQFTIDGETEIAVTLTNPTSVPPAPPAPPASPGDPGPDAGLAITGGTMAWGLPVLGIVLLLAGISGLTIRRLRTARP